MAERKSALKKLGRALLAALFWLIVWQLASLAVDKELLLPSPLLAARTWVELASTGRFWLETLLSLLRVAIGFAAGTALGAALAFLTHYMSGARLLLAPVIGIVRAVPVASFIILALVWIRTEALPSFIAAAMALPIVWQNLSGALDSDVDPGLIEMARVYRVGRLRIFTRIVLPSVFPAFVSGAVGALGFAWKSGVAAEVICQPALSIGRQLQTAKQTLETPRVFAWTATVCLLSMLLERLLRSVAARLGKGRAS